MNRSKKDRKALAQELQALFKELQSLPSSQALTEEDIAVEINAYRRGEGDFKRYTDGIEIGEVS